MAYTPKIVMITGANRGIGLAIAKSFLEKGDHVVLTCRDPKKLPQEISDHPNAMAISLDVNDDDQIKSVFMAVKKAHGRIDVFVNNAGIMLPGMIALTRPEMLDQMINTNIRGAFLCAQIASRIMLSKKSGSIINITSIMGTQGAAGYSAYSLTKAAIIGMTKSLSKELAASQIRVNAVAPGFVETDLTNGIDEDGRQKVLENIGMKRFASAEDISNLVVFLGSDKAAYITGQVIGIDGGMVA